MSINLDHFSLEKSEENELSKVRFGMIDYYLCEFVWRKRNKKNQYFEQILIDISRFSKKVNYFSIIKVLFSYLTITMSYDIILVSLCFDWHSEIMFVSRIQA